MSNEPKTKITIVGLGLIGGSLGLALKAGLPDVEIVGHDRDADVELKAQKMGAITRREHNLPRAIEGASIVIVATPITTMADVFKQIAPHLLTGALVTDTASTKAEVMRWAEEMLCRARQLRRRPPDGRQRDRRHRKRGGDALPGAATASARR